MARLREWVSRALAFLTLTGKDGTLNLTHLAVAALLIGTLLQPESGYPMAMALMVAIANLAHDRHERAKSSREANQQAVLALEKMISAVDTKVLNLSSQVSTLSGLHQAIQNQSEETHRQIEETKKLISTSNLAHAFKAPQRRGHVAS